MMINYNSASSLRTFLEQEGLGMQKKFGQNFLINPAIRQALVQALNSNGSLKPESNCEVWEIGPGLGAMTVLLLEKGFKVRAFEIDTGFIRILKRIFAEEKNFSLVEGDCFKTWMNADNQAKFLLGNLPYNIAAALIADFIEKSRVFSRMVITVQKEVALRMMASAGSPDYSSFSVLCASVYRVKPLMTIRRESFYPQPNVDSMGVLLENKNREPCPYIFYPLVRSLFSSRRKTIKNNLLKFTASKDICAALLSENGLSGNERAEDLDLEVFLSLAKSYERIRSSSAKSALNFTST